MSPDYECIDCSGPGSYLNDSSCACNGTLLNGTECVPIHVAGPLFDEDTEASLIIILWALLAFLLLLLLQCCWLYCYKTRGKSGT